MVDPEWRRRGIATALVDAASTVCRDRGYGPVLLVTPRTGAGGREFALRRGGVLDHSEYALELTREPADAPSDPRTTIRPARAMHEGDAVDDLLLVGFGWQRPAGEAPGAPDGTRVVERDGELVGTLRVIHDGPGEVGVYGFVVRGDLRGRGIGRDVLRRICRQAFTDGAARVHLEVEIGNDRALGLYVHRIRPGLHRGLLRPAGRAGHERWAGDSLTVQIGRGARPARALRFLCSEISSIVDREPRGGDRGGEP